MLKQQVSRIEKVLTMLLPVLFIVSLTSAAVSADQEQEHQQIQIQKHWQLQKALAAP